jgi:hypothetical protein
MAIATALLEELEDTLSSPAGSALREFVLRDDRKSALEIIQYERFSLEQAEVIYDHCRIVWGGVDIDLVEIPLAQALETLARLDADAGHDENLKPRYVVRDGTRLSSTGAYFERGEWCVYLDKTGFVPLSRIRQLWHVQPKTVASESQKPPEN